MEVVFWLAVIGIVVTVVCCTFQDDYESWQEGRRERQELRAYRSELDAIAAQRARKREVMRQLRSTARQARRDRDRWSS